jgi:hypothetical protein
VPKHLDFASDLFFQFTHFVRFALDIGLDIFFVTVLNLL